LSTSGGNCEDEATDSAISKMLFGHLSNPQLLNKMNYKIKFDSVCGVAFPYTQTENVAKLTLLMRKCIQVTVLSPKFRTMIPNTFYFFYFNQTSLPQFVGNQ